jgi:hypothetical protein
MGAQAGAPGTMSLATPAPAEPPAPEAKMRVFSFVPRIGIQLGGSGSGERNCEGTLCGDANSAVPEVFGSGSSDFDLKTGFVVGADFMFKVHDLIRIGPGLLHTFTTDMTPDGGSSQEMGSLTEFNFVGEVIPKVSPTVWLVPRIQVGMMMFNASGASKDGMTAYKNYCSDLAANSGATVNGCNSFDNPHLGYDVGAGFGVMFAVGPTIRLRADALYEHFSVSGGSMDVTSPAGDTLKQTYTASANRYFLMGGLEI